MLEAILHGIIIFFFSTYVSEGSISEDGNSIGYN